MGRYWLVLWVLGQYNLVLLGIKWYWVSIGLLCLYILKKNGDLVGCYHSGITNERTNNEQGKIRLLSQWTMEGWGVVVVVRAVLGNMGQYRALLVYI